MPYFSNHAKSRKKCAVIGCHGVGAAVAHALALSGLVNSLVLIDRDKKLADGYASDLCGALPLHADTDIWAGDDCDLADCSLIVLCQGECALHESAHADLISLNAPLIRSAVSTITAYAPHAIILVLSQPVDLMTYTALQYSGLPGSRVIGIGTLAAELILKRLIAKYLGTDASQISTMILGQANLHATPCWSLTHIAGVPLDTFLHSGGRSIDLEVTHSLFNDALYMLERAETAKGRAELTLAAATLGVADAILSDCNTLIPVSTLTQGYCELPSVCMSLPCLVNATGAHVASQIIPARPELEQLLSSAARIRSQWLECEQLFLQK